MMDEEDSQVPIWSYRVNLDKRVRDDHPLRRIRAAPSLAQLASRRRTRLHRRARSTSPEYPPGLRGSVLTLQDPLKMEGGRSVLDGHLDFVIDDQGFKDRPP